MSGGAKVACSSCGRQPARVYVKTRPRDYAELRRLLCAACATRLRYVRPDYSRKAAPAPVRSAQRPSGPFGGGR